MALIGLDLVLEAMEKVKLIRKRLKRLKVINSHIRMLGRGILSFLLVIGHM